MMLRRVSAKRAREQRERRKTLQAMAEQHGGQVCHRCFSAPADDGHELLTRAQGGSITDPDNIRPLCRRCHNWVTTHPAEAARDGWLLTRKYRKDTDA